MFRVIQTTWKTLSHITTGVHFEVPWLAILLAAMLGIAGCEGDTGPQGPAGAQGEQGEQGEQGPAGADGNGGSLPDVTEAAEINAAITGVTIASPPVVQFTLTDERGQGLTGLQPSAISFTIAKLEDGTNGNASAWQSYVNQVESPRPEDPGTEDQVQATRDRATAEGAELVDNGDGTYQYTFATDVMNVTDPIAVAYDDSLTHRVGIEIRGLAPVINPTYTFRPSDGATMGIFSRAMINDDSCNACHDQLALHGNGRFTNDYCVTCHNPGSIDANSANTVDFKVMIHKIHRGEFLPTIENGVGGEKYSIFGFNDSEHIYAENIGGESLGVVFPQDIRNCVNCHDESDTTTPDAGNWFRVPTAEACGSCHDDVNFATGENHIGGDAGNDECTICHGEGEFLAANDVHRLLDQEAAEAYQYNIIGATMTGQDEAPVITFSITNPLTDPPTPYLLTDDAFTQPESRVAITFGWDTDDYYNEGSGSEVPGFRPGSPAQTVSLDALGGSAVGPDADGAYTITSGVSVPANAEGSLAVTIEGHVAADLENNGIFHEVPVTGVVDFFPITDPSAVARRDVVDIDVCNDCHQSLSLHGGNRTDEPQMCVTCHNANATDIRARVEAGVDAGTSADGKKEEVIDFKHMVHAIHAGAPFIYGFFGSEHDYRHVEFPGHLNNCGNCHDGDTFYPVDQTAVLATTIDSGALLGDPTDDVNISPTASACWGCHQSEDVTEEATPASAQSHMVLNGASFNATQAADGTLTDIGTMGVVVESCEVCHSEGRSNDVAVAHGVD